MQLPAAQCLFGDGVFEGGPAVDAAVNDAVAEYFGNFGTQTVQKPVKFAAGELVPDFFVGAAPSGKVRDGGAANLVEGMKVGDVGDEFAFKPVAEIAKKNLAAVFAAENPFEIRQIHH